MLGVAFCVIVFLAAFPSAAFAVQAHGGAEGLVAHQIGHVLFIVGMGSLLYKVNFSRMTGPGWAHFRIFIWLLIAWNVLTFSGHWLNERVPTSQFIKSNGFVESFLSESPLDFYYYLTRLDHLLLVPSFVFLFLALRAWRAQP